MDNSVQFLQSRKSGRGMLYMGYDGLSMEGRSWRIDRVEKVFRECSRWVMIAFQWRNERNVCRVCSGGMGMAMFHKLWL